MNRLAWGEPIRAPETLLREAGCPKQVIRHCRAVCVLAGTFTHTFPVNRELLTMGAMLHDIGRAKTHALQHAQIGADICRTMGIPEDVALIVERHIGAGLTADECTLLGLLPRDCVPKTIEEKIVANADNLMVGEIAHSIEDRLLSVQHLPRKVRKRMFRLALEMELFR